LTPSSHPVTLTLNGLLETRERKFLNSYSRGQCDSVRSSCNALEMTPPLINLESVPYSGLRQLADVMKLGACTLRRSNISQSLRCASQELSLTEHFQTGISEGLWSLAHTSNLCWAPDSPTSGSEL
jgi:hypothetical protein